MVSVTILLAFIISRDYVVAILVPGREFVGSEEAEVVHNRSRVPHFDCDCIDHPVPLVEVLEGVEHELFLELLHLRVLDQLKVL